MKGLEPPHLSVPDPKSGAATNYATSAGQFAKIQFFFQLNDKKYKKILHRWLFFDI